MNSDESPRNMQYSSNRKPFPPKNQVYSPSSSYNYNGSQSQHGGNHGNHGSQSYGNQPYGNQQHQRRKPMPFKRDNPHSSSSSSSSSSSASDKLAKQNDIIIRLLKEIRDRLPAPPASTAVVEASETDMVDEAVALIQENIAADSETGVEQESEPESETESEPEDLGPTLPAVVAPPPHLDDEELDEVANGNR